MKSFEKIKILSADAYKQKVSELGAKIHFVDIHYNKSDQDFGIQAIKDPGEPFIFMADYQAEWLLENL